MTKPANWITLWSCWLERIGIDKSNHLLNHNVLFTPSEFVFSSTGQRRWAGESELCRIFHRGASSASKRHLLNGRTTGCFHVGKSQVRNEASFCPHRYVGELISDAEADVREDDSYLFDLDNKVHLFMKSVFYEVFERESVFIMHNLCEQWWVSKTMHVLPLVFPL